MKLQEERDIINKNGGTLRISLYKPESIKAAVMISPATGIRRSFYHRFALYLAEHNFGVITYDNEGIGDSLKGSIRKLDTDLISWGQHDMTAVLEELKSEFPNTHYHLIGHSAGGQLVGLMDNCTDLSSMLCVSSSSGAISNMYNPFKRKAKFFLNSFIPLSNMLFGYSKTNLLGMGGPLPKKVGAQWKEFCNTKGYLYDELGTNVKQHYYDSLNIPSMWIHALDDPIANYENVKDMRRVYSQMKGEIMTIDPYTYSYSELGHMKFFTESRKRLWKIAINWLGKN